MGHAAGAPTPRASDSIHGRGTWKAINDLEGVGKPQKGGHLHREQEDGLELQAQPPRVRRLAM